VICEGAGDSRASGVDSGGVGVPETEEEVEEEEEEDEEEEGGAVDLTGRGLVSSSVVTDCISSSTSSRVTAFNPTSFKSRSTKIR
jgi:hypothetical protein